MRKKNIITAFFHGLSHFNCVSISFLKPTSRDRFSDAWAIWKIFIWIKKRSHCFQKCLVSRLESQFITAPSNTIKSVYKNCDVRCLQTFQIKCSYFIWKFPKRWELNPKMKQQKDTNNHWNNQDSSYKILYNFKKFIRFYTIIILNYQILHQLILTWAIVPCWDSE